MTTIEASLYKIKADYRSSKLNICGKMFLPIVESHGWDTQFNFTEFDQGDVFVLLERTKETGEKFFCITKNCYVYTDLHYGFDDRFEKIA